MPDIIRGGTPGNPMGAAAMTLGISEYAIHGTNAPGSVGGFVSYGCIRMYNQRHPRSVRPRLARHAGRGPEVARFNSSRSSCGGSFVTGSLPCRHRLAGTIRSLNRSYLNACQENCSASAVRKRALVFLPSPTSQRARIITEYRGRRISNKLADCARKARRALHVRAQQQMDHRRLAALKPRALCQSFLPSECRSRHRARQDPAARDQADPAGRRNHLRLRKGIFRPVFPAGQMPLRALRRQEAQQ